MYLLYRLQPRAETTDTLIFYVSDSKEALEEIVLSLFEELYEKDLAWADREGYTDLEGIRKWCIDKMKRYKILEVPFMED
jgi:hypothetical protein